MKELNRVCNSLEQFKEYVFECINEIGNKLDAPDDMWQDILVVISKDMKLSLCPIPPPVIETPNFRNFLAEMALVIFKDQKPAFAGLVLTVELYYGPALVVQLFDTKTTEYYKARILTYRDLPPQLGPWFKEEVDPIKKSAYPTHILQRAYDLYSLTKRS